MAIESTTQTDEFYTIADSCLLAPYDIDTVGLQQVFGQILKHKVDYADLIFSITALKVGR